MKRQERRLKERGSRGSRLSCGEGRFWRKMSCTLSLIDCKYVVLNNIYQPKEENWVFFSHLLIKLLAKNWLPKLVSNFPNFILKSNLARGLINVIIFGVLFNELEFPQRWRWCLKDLSNVVARSYVPKEVRRGDGLHDGDYGSNPNALVWKLTNLAQRRKKRKNKGERNI